MRADRWQEKSRCERSDGTRKRNCVGINLVEIGKDMVTKTRGSGAGRRKRRKRGWENANLAKANADPAASVDGIGVERGCCRTGMQIPNGRFPSEDDIREGRAAIKVSWQGNKEDETREMEMGGEERHKVQDSVEPKQLRREHSVGATTIHAGEPRITVDKPSQSRVKARRVEDGWGAEERKMTRQLGQGVGDMERIGKSGTTQRSSWGFGRLENDRGCREKRRMGFKGMGNGTELRSEG